MPEKETNTLCRHPAFYPAASGSPGQVKQILHHHFFRKIMRLHIGMIRKKITQLGEIITNSERTVMTNR